MIPYLLASLVHHKPYLLEMQCRNSGHPLFLQRVWTSGVIDRLAPSVEAGCNRNAKSRMFATGVPSHLVLANSIVGLQRELDVLRTEVITKLNLPEALKQCMLQNFNVEGTIPITPQTGLFQPTFPTPVARRNRNTGGVVSLAYSCTTC